MSELLSGPPDPPLASSAAQDPPRARTGEFESTAGWIGIPAVLGAVLGTVTCWVRLALLEPGRSAEDSLGLLFVAMMVGPPALVVVSWAALALTHPAWVAPTVTIAGLATATYALILYGMVAGTSGTPSVALYAVVWGASYAAVALACLPGLSRPVRGAIVALLIIPGVLVLVL